MSYKVETTSHFDKEAKRLAKKYKSLKSDLSALIKNLKQHPTEGIFLGENIHKIKMAITSKGKGKRGGARIITLVKIINETVYLLSIYSKGEKDDISAKEIQRLIKEIE